MAADCVHRDIRPDNFILTQEGRLFLIDLQFAVSASKYKELPILKKNQHMLLGLGDKFSPGKCLWDDMYSLVKILDFIGREEVYGDDFDDTLLFVKENVGKWSVSYDVKKERSKVKVLIKVLSLLISIKKWRKKFRKMWDN